MANVISLESPEYACVCVDINGKDEEELSAKCIFNEVFSSRNDNQIAYQLYKDAKEVLFKNYNAYPSLNNKFKEFKKDYQKLPKMDQKVVKEKYVAPTSFARSIEQFLNYKILSLAKKIRPKEYKRLLKTYSPSKEIRAGFPLLSPIRYLESGLHGRPQYKPCPRMDDCPYKGYVCISSV